MGRSLLKMSNEEIFESSLRFIFKQLDIYVEANKQVENKYKSNNKGYEKEEKKLMVLD